jgi:hypothetical protein
VFSREMDQAYSAVRYSGFLLFLARLNVNSLDYLPSVGGPVFGREMDQAYSAVRYSGFLLFLARLSWTGLPPSGRWTSV